MDDVRFDALTRALAAGASRRTVLKRLGAGLGGVLVGTLALRHEAGAAGCFAGTFGDPCEVDDPAASCCPPFTCLSDDDAQDTCGCPDGLVFCAATNTCVDLSTQCCADADCPPEPCAAASCVLNPCGDPSCDFKLDVNTCRYTPITCPAGLACQTAGVCNPESGECEYGTTCHGATICCDTGRHSGRCVGAPACK